MGLPEGPLALDGFSLDPSCVGLCWWLSGKESSIVAWEIPWTEEPGRLQSTGSQRVRRDLVTKPPPPPVLHPAVQGCPSLHLELGSTVSLSPEMLLGAPRRVQEQGKVIKRNGSPRSHLPIGHLHPDVCCIQAVSQDAGPCHPLLPLNRALPYMENYGIMRNLTLE